MPPRGLPLLSTKVMLRATIFSWLEVAETIPWKNKLNVNPPNIPDATIKRDNIVFGK
jgi:hypothetical protein